MMRCDNKNNKYRSGSDHSILVLELLGLLRTCFRTVGTLATVVRSVQHLEPLQW